jgi:NAD(P)-dependent dehydrogenase (short-subunit alcohol dehydrogenase family)
MNAQFGLQGRFALLTGGSDAALTARLRDEGMTVDQLDVDLRDRADCDRALAEAIRSAGASIDLLVCTQEMRLDASLEETPESTLQELLERNLTAAFRIGRACFSAMREDGGGSMVFVGSDAGIRATHESPAFSVTSGGLIAIAELFAAEGAAHGIRANAVCPSLNTDVAPIVVWLASDQSRNVNGATLRVDDASGAAMVLDTRI